MKLHTCVMDTPIGRLTLVARDDALVAVAFEDYPAETRTWLERRFPQLEMESRRDPAGAASALRAYFGGELTALDRVAVDPAGTPFQQAVWSELRHIPSGATLSYAALAARVGKPSAVRAVGAANGSNPIPVIIPCHRVIAANGTLCGYGGGLDRKRWLLSHEKARFRGDATPASLPRQIPLL